jgi:hypothetical protein
MTPDWWRPQQAEHLGVGHAIECARQGGTAQHEAEDGGNESQPRQYHSLQPYSIA